MFRKILIPLNGSKEASAILPYVSQLAKGLDAQLLLLSVVDGSTTEASRSYFSSLMEQTEEGARNRLDPVLTRLAEDGIEATAEVTSGKVEAEIVGTAERTGCDVIAMSTGGRSFRGGILGSVAEAVLHSSRLPVLTVSPAKAEEYGQGTAITRIVAPLDGSDLAEDALPYVEYAARKLELDVLLVRVVKPGRMFWMDEFPPGLDEEQRRIDQQAESYLKGVAGRLGSHGLAVETRVSEGHPVTALAELAHEPTNDLIVLATHSRAGISRWALGSVAAAIVKSAGEPVLIVPPAGDQR